MFIFLFHKNNNKCNMDKNNGISNIFFDMIKVLENAIEIHY